MPKWSGSATNIAGTTAAAGQTKAVKRVTNAAGMRRRRSGRMSRLTGRAKMVMRWK
jgi:hypothetical protein